MTGANLELLYEVTGLPAFDLPSEIEEKYGGPLGLSEPIVVANFVSSLDGVVAAPPLPQSAKLVSGDSETDRFVVALLRALADVVLVGSGTLRASPTSRWAPEGPYPQGREAFADIRRRRGRAEAPLLVVLTGTGLLDPEHPALEAGALVLTTDDGAAALDGRLPRSEVVSLGPGRHVDLEAAVGLLRARGHRVVLSEAGPHLFGSLVTARLADELFLTLSPVLAGREEGSTRLALLEGHDVLGSSLGAERLLSVRRDGAHLFLRYELRRDA